MRGTHHGVQLLGDRAGIIPADAGNTRSWAATRTWTGDHPRGCGEHVSWSLMAAGLMGSSPRMRGTRHDGCVDPALPGIIPADAGNTPSDSSIGAASADHPRGCGEHRLGWVGVTLGGGSTPRMRGTPTKPCTSGTARGIIPADAGNTAVRSAEDLCGTDHPRGCGEHPTSSMLFSVLLGSSPRMRGTHPVAAGMEAARRIIPADAGNTRVGSTTTLPAGDHPRGCGEHRFQVRYKLPTEGSSPRMRGTHYLACAFGDRVGIIPADAGNTALYLMLDVWTRDHPRGCGEHRISNCFRNATIGSSPRMRGTLPAIRLNRIR